MNITISLNVIFEEIIKFSITELSIDQIEAHILKFCTQRSMHGSFNVAQPPSVRLCLESEKYKKTPT